MACLSIPTFFEVAIRQNGNWMKWDWMKRKWTKWYMDEMGVEHFVKGSFVKCTCPFWFTCWYQGKNSLISPRISQFLANLSLMSSFSIPSACRPLFWSSDYAVVVVVDIQLLTVTVSRATSDWGSVTHSNFFSTLKFQKLHHSLLWLTCTNNSWWQTGTLHGNVSTRCSTSVSLKIRSEYTEKAGYT